MDPVEIMKWAGAVFCVTMAIFGIVGVYFAVQGGREAVREDKAKRPTTVLFDGD